MADSVFSAEEAAALSAARSVPTTAFKEVGAPYKELRFLVVEDQEASRKTLKMCIQSMGGFYIDVAVSHGDAIFRIRNNLPDIIICDYILGDGRTGQQLLEELRRSALLPDRVVFLMVTAERSYEQVVSAVELTPDDYVIKPFSPEVLGLRIDKAVQKKYVFRGYYDLKEAKQLDRAVDELEDLIKQDQGKPYRYDILRYRAETLAAAGRTEEALSAYEDIIALFPFPWAKAGLARMLQRQDRLDEARKAVDEVIAMSPNYFEAYDLKAAICTDDGDYDAAQSTLTRAAARSPRNWARKRLLSTVALHNGDVETASVLIREVVQHDTVGGVSLNDNLNMARCALAGGDAKAAKAAMQSVGAVDLEAASATERIEFECLLAVMEGPAGAKRYERMRRAIADLGDVPVQTSVDIARAALVFDDRQMSNLTTERMLVGKQARLAFQPLLAVYRQHGLEEVFRKIQNHAALKRLNKV
jgi:DNA-binding response OmpR family regulator